MGGEEPPRCYRDIISRSDFIPRHRAGPPPLLPPNSFQIEALYMRSEANTETMLLQK